MKLGVSELFGPTLQGEGERLGTPTMFVRTQYCPVGCSFCDTKFSWPEAKPDQLREPSDIVHELEEQAGEVRHCVISGGEPFTQGDAVEALTKLLLNRGWEVEIETSGTFRPPEFFRRVVPNLSINVSPKPPSAQTKLKTDGSAIVDFNKARASFKFVVANEEDLRWVRQFLTDHFIQHSNTFIMPEGYTRERLQETGAWLWERLPQVLPRCRMTPRMHVDLFGPKRGI